MRLPRRELSERELKILELISEGKTHNDISLMLGSSYCTVHNQVQSIYDKLGAVNKAHAVAIAKDKGLLGRLPCK